MSLGDTPCVIAQGGRYEIEQIAERLDFNEDGDGTFIVLHFARETANPAPRLRVRVTRDIYEKYRENSN